MQNIISEANHALLGTGHNRSVSKEKIDQFQAEIKRLNLELKEQKMREIKLKGLHEDEIRCSSDIYETQNQLNLSKIKELEATNFHL